MNGDPINYARLAAEREAAKATWDMADPFPWCQFSEFLHPEHAQRIAHDFPETIARQQKTPKSHHNVGAKLGVPTLEIMSEAQRAFFESVNSPEFCSFLSRLTSIDPIYPDPDLTGGGLHEIYAGGFLNVHADFNFHPKKRWLRCLNLIVYLNPDWKDAWEGHLELWPEMLDRDPVKIRPDMNTAALFRTSETSWHGHPTPLAAPDGVRRRSLAVYFYTDWPDGLEARSQTLYVLTPHQRTRLAAVLQAAGVTCEEDALRAAPGYLPRHVQEVFADLNGHTP